jgi:DNA N-6-adenine-methyltransferase (Dam)
VASSAPSRSKVEALSVEARRLAQLPPHEYDRVRKAEAKRLDVRTATLDAAVEAIRNADRSDDSATKGQALDLPEPEAWHEPVEGVLDDLIAAIRKYVSLDEHKALAVSLWALHTHCMEWAYVAPRLHVTSPAPNCPRACRSMWRVLDPGPSELRDAMGRVGSKPTSASARQAQKYMRFARVVRVKPELVSSHSTLNDALSLVADRRAHPDGSGSVEFYTPYPFIEAARRVMGEIDLDPASCAQAQQQVQARAYFSAQDDGLAKEWRGRVWINPPYRNAGRFVDKLLEEIAADRVTEALLLVHAFTELKWFHAAATECSAICFPRERIHFTRPEDDQTTRSAFGSAVIYFGPNINGFRTAYAPLGLVMLPARDAP